MTNGKPAPQEPDDELIERLKDMRDFCRGTTHTHPHPNNVARLCEDVLAVLQAKAPETGKNNMDSADALVRDLIPFLTNAAQMFDEMKMERGNKWTAYNQDQRERLTVLLQWAHTLVAST